MDLENELGLYNFIDFVKASEDTGDTRNLANDNYRVQWKNQFPKKNTYLQKNVSKSSLSNTIVH